jgi:hypothetical protein
MVEEDSLTQTVFGSYDYFHPRYHRVIIINLQGWVPRRIEIINDFILYGNP